jgi:hypothetical protein
MFVVAMIGIRAGHHVGAFCHAGGTIRRLPLAWGR